MSSPGLMPAGTATTQTTAVAQQAAAGSSKLTFLDELKRRKVLNVVTVYLMTAWVVVEATTELMEVLKVSGMDGYVWLAAALGLPIAIALAWLFEVSREGVRRTGTFEVAGATNTRWPLISRRALLVVAGIAGLYVVFEVVRRVFFASA